MKAHLLFPDRDLNLNRPPVWNEAALARDLALDPVLEAMAEGDGFVLEVCRFLMFHACDNDGATITHRQQVLAACLVNRSLTRSLYKVATDGAAESKKHYLGGFLSRDAEWTLRWAVELMEGLFVHVRRLRTVADVEAGALAATALSPFVAMVQRELNDTYLARAQFHLKRLKFRQGMIFSAGLGAGAKAERMSLNPPPVRAETWLTRFLPVRPQGLSFSIHPRDEGGIRALGQIRARAVAGAARALAQAGDHVGDFFVMLRRELAFYVGCINLIERLEKLGLPTSMPVWARPAPTSCKASQLYDVSLALSSTAAIVGNDIDADERSLLVITGANQGGKSTFMRALGVAQILMQMGMMAPARSFRSSLCDGMFTHYKREEDVNLLSGKLDEELARMSDIIDHLTPRPLILFNESFASTNEREGSDIAIQVLTALAARKARLVFVTHLYDAARHLYADKRDDALFLRAERTEDGGRTFHLKPGEPLATSFGDDLYRQIFGAAGAAPAKPSHATEGA